MVELPNTSSGSSSLWDFAETKPSADDFAIRARNTYEALIELGADPTDTRALLVFQMGLMQQRKLIGKNHRTLAEKMLPKASPPKPGRPKAALGKAAYDKRYNLYRDWVGEKALKPKMTKERFARDRLKITDSDLVGNYEYEHRAKIDALLQELKPARMKRLDEDQKRTLETIYPLLVTYPIHLAREWLEAKQRSPGLTKEDFLQYEIFKWPRGRKRHLIETEIIHEHLEKLNDGEKQLADLGTDKKVQRAQAQRNRSRPRR